ncbi:PTS system, trehalose-specific IIBC component, partial [Vibrio parahaemolyticus V-223/04]
RFSSSYPLVCVGRP